MGEVRSAVDAGLLEGGAEGLTTRTDQYDNEGSTVGLHRTDTTRIESVRVATRLKLSVKADQAPTVEEIVTEAMKLDRYYRTGSLEETK